MVRLGVKQVLMPSFQAEEPSAGAPSSAAHSWALGRGYDAAGRQESLTSMRFGVLRFSGLPFLCKKVGETAEGGGGSSQAGRQPALVAGSLQCRCCRPGCPPLLPHPALFFCPVRSPPRAHARPSSTKPGQPC
jgi:hypothetical protein